MTRAFFSPRVPGLRGVRERFAYQRRLFEVPGQAFDRKEHVRILSSVVGCSVWMMNSRFALVLICIDVVVGFCEFGF